MSTYVVIMAGGIGSRFWPVSKKKMPKQFLDVMGVGQSLLQLTFKRFENHFDSSKILIVTNEEYKDIVKEQLPNINSNQILLEPSAKNTAPCIAFAAYRINAQEPDANCIIAPSDHLILNEKEFLSKIDKALDFAEKNDSLVTLGIKPSRPDTGYGYIQYLKNEEEVNKVKIFTEKPDIEMAEQFLESGDFLWNAGIFVWNNRSIMKALENHTPEINTIFNKGANLFGTKKEEKFIEEAYPLCKNISIDYAILEKAENVYVIPSEFGWSDLGTWKSLYNEREHDENGNLIHGTRNLNFDTKNSLIFSNTDKLIVTNGIEDLMIIESEDVLLISKLDKEQEVKRIVNEVKTQFKDYFS